MEKTRQAYWSGLLSVAGFEFPVALWRRAEHQSMGVDRVPGVRTPRAKKPPGELPGPKIPAGSGVGVRVGTSRIQLPTEKFKGTVDRDIYEIRGQKQLVKKLVVDGLLPASLLRLADVYVPFWVEPDPRQKTREADLKGYFLISRALDELHCFGLGRMLSKNLAQVYVYVGVESGLLTAFQLYMDEEMLPEDAVIVPPPPSYTRQELLSCLEALSKLRSDSSEGARPDLQKRRLARLIAREVRAGRLRI